MQKKLQQIVSPAAIEVHAWPRKDGYEMAVKAGNWKSWMYTDRGASMLGRIDAFLIHAHVRYYKPKKIVEIGSGYSTRVTAAALIRNENDWGVISQFKVSDGLLQSAVHVFMICFTGFCLR